MLLIASTVLPAADRVTLSSSTLSKNRIYLISVSSSCMYSLLISTLIARRLSMILLVLLAPGIATRDELLCNNHAIIIWYVDVSYFSASFFNNIFSARYACWECPPTGLCAIKVILFSSQNLTTPLLNEVRSNRLHRFCTDMMCVMESANWICSTVTLDKPMC